MSITNDTNLIEIIKAFPEFGRYVGFEPVDNGHINDTYIIKYEKSGRELPYLLQRINTNVFKKPAELMENIIGVTAFLREKIKAAGGDPTRETLTVYLTKEGRNFFLAPDGSYWRLYNFVGDTYTLNEISSAEVFRGAAESFGNFQKLLADYPIATLYETIPNFHNTVSRFADFKRAVRENASGRRKEAKDEIDFVLAREKDASVLTDLIKKGEIPLRVTHNDTKLNNILFDNKTDKGICIVDLDTVMPGLSLYDFGDSIRFGASTAAEDEKDLSKVTMSLDLFSAYTDGYLKAAGSILTENEIRYLAFSAKLLTYECGMRFLADFLNGDTYFKISYPDHNLVRARTQLKLVADMEEKAEQMEEIVQQTRKKYGI